MGGDGKGMRDEVYVQREREREREGGRVRERERERVREGALLLTFQNLTLSLPNAPSTSFTVVYVCLLERVFISVCLLTPKRHHP